MTDPPRSSRHANVRRYVAVALIVLGASYGLTQWLGWRIAYTHSEVGGPSIDAKAFAALNTVRETTEQRWKVVSGYRSKAHNKAVGGAKHSQHVAGRAFDVIVPMGDRAEFYEAAKDAGFVAFGWGNRTVHVDTGPRRWWTYDNAGKHLSGTARHRHLHKAPDNFRRDFRVVSR